MFACAAAKRAIGTRRCIGSCRKEGIIVQIQAGIHLVGAHAAAQNVVRCICTLADTAFQAITIILAYEEILFFKIAIFDGAAENTCHKCCTCTSCKNNLSRQIHDFNLIVGTCYGALSLPNGYRRLLASVLSTPQSQSILTHSCNKRKCLL